MTNVYVLSCSPYSVTKVARDIAHANDFTLVNGYYNPYKLHGTGILVCNPDFEARRIVSLTKNLRFILYLVTEGPIRTDVRWVKDHYVVTPSKYAKAKLEGAGVNVDDVIPHGVRFVSQPRTHNNRVFGYIGGYMRRKYPTYGIEALKRVNINTIVITTPNNPYINLFKIVDTRAYTLGDHVINSFYSMISWYLNLSDSEGFGLTPLEACAMGVPVIAPRLPVFTETLPPNATLWVELTGETWYEPHRFELVEHFVYSTESMVRRLIEAQGMSDARYAALSREAYEWCKQFDYRTVYRRFQCLV